jgi:lysophospholipase L1-like esterase
MTEKNSGQTSKWSKRKLFSFALFTTLILFAALEIIFRIVFFFQFYTLHTSSSIQGSPLQISDSVLIFRNQPFYVDYERKYQNNEEGMKSEVGDEYIGTKTDKDFWVLLTGASAMEGMGSNRNGEWLDITGVDDHPANATIAAYLQQLLQEKMPDKKVKVFNGATSSFTTYQSHMRYVTLAEKLKPDWVISMDGVNDPSSLKEGQSMMNIIKDNWNQSPQFSYPLKQIIFLTRHSSLLNAIKQMLFHIKQNIRQQKAIKNNFPARIKWLHSTAPPLRFAVLSDDIKRGVASFSLCLLAYDSALNARHQNHLLLIQPQMCFRDTTQLGDIEKAVNHYYRATFQDSIKQAYLKGIYDRFSAKDSLHKNIVEMKAVHSWPGWVFVDYCHFSDEATKKIAQEIYNYIISDGHAEIFKK